MIRERVAKAAEQVDSIIKAFVVGADVQDPASIPGGEDADFATAGAIPPPYDPATLCLLFEHSNSLRQNVDAYATNIDAFGCRLEPAVDLEADDADQRVADSILLERLAAQERGRLPEGVPLDATPEEIAARKTQLAKLARVEKARLENFFEFACIDHSFVDLRRRTRQDLEVTGNAYWEVLRDGAGRIARLVYVPSFSVRLLPIDRDPIEVPERRRVSPVTFEVVPSRIRVRKFVQIQDHSRAFFKQMGDPRVVSKLTGAVFPTVEAMLAKQPADAPATEMIHFAVHSARSPYGVPRWIGGLLSVLGSRESEEVNYLYFSNKSVPPLALLVSGGHLSEASVPRIQNFIEEHLKGKKNFHKILILEAESAGGPTDDTSRARIELRPLTEAQQQDALFQNYDQRNSDKVGASFRLPRLLRGEGTDFNRSVADAQLRFAEDQVFQPERDEFDFFINRTLFSDMGIRFWRFRSQTPLARDPERLTDMVEKLVRVGVLVPEEGRSLANDIFNREFRRIKDDWTKRPITLTLAGIQSGNAVEEPNTAPSGILDDARKLLGLRARLEAEEERLAKERLAMARRYHETETERVTVPSAEFAEWFEREGT